MLYSMYGVAITPSAIAETSILPGPIEITGGALTVIGDEQSLASHDAIVAACATYLPNIPPKAHCMIIGAGTPLATYGLGSTNYLAAGGGSLPRMLIRNEVLNGYLDIEVGGFYPETLSPEQSFATNGRMRIEKDGPIRIYTTTGVGIEINSKYPDPAARNWVLAFSYVEQGDFALVRSNSKDGNPWTNGTIQLYISAAGAMTIPSLAGAGMTPVCVNADGVLQRC